MINGWLTHSAALLGLAGVALSACGAGIDGAGDGATATTLGASGPTSTVDGFIYETETTPAAEVYRPPILNRAATDADDLPTWVTDAGWPELPGVRRGPSADGFTLWIHPRAEDGFCVILTDDEAKEFTPGCATFAEHTNQGRLEPKALPTRTDSERHTVFAGVMLPGTTGITHPDGRLDVTYDEGVFLAFGPRPDMNPIVEYAWPADRADLIEACGRLYADREGTTTTDDGETVTAARCEQGQIPEWTKVYTQATWERFGNRDEPITVDLADYGPVTQTLAPTPSTTDQPRPPFASRIARAEIVEEEVAVFWWFEANDGAPLWCVHAVDRVGVSATRCITELDNGALRVQLDDERMVQVVTAYFDMAFFTVTPVQAPDAPAGMAGDSVVQVTNGRRRGAVVIPPGQARITLHHPDGRTETGYLTPK